MGQWLKAHGLHPQIRNMYETLLAHFDQYQNDAVKHGEAYAYAPFELEFMIYLTGTFIRLLLQIDAEAQPGDSSPDAVS